MKYLKVRIAFTLAEVLVTLLIIGIIASLVIPSVINDTNNAEYVVMLKKSYSTFQQAFDLLKIENGGSIVPVFENDTTTNYGNGAAMNAFLTKLNYIKNCGRAKGCWYTTSRHYLSGKISEISVDQGWDNKYEKAILGNGAMLLIWVRSTNCTDNEGSGPLNNSVCASIEVDVNGAKGPNIKGRDYFPFWITKTGIYPEGSYDDGNTCSLTSLTHATDWGCTAKVLTDNGMNY